MTHISSTSPLWGLSVAQEVMAAAVECGVGCTIFGPDDRDILFSCCDSQTPCSLRLVFNERVVTREACQQSRIVDIELFLDLCITDEVDDGVSVVELEQRATLRWQILAGLLSWRQRQQCDLVTIDGWSHKGQVGDCFRWVVDIIVEQPVL